MRSTGSLCSLQAGIWLAVPCSLLLAAAAAGMGTSSRALYLDATTARKAQSGATRDAGAESRRLEARATLVFEAQAKHEAVTVARGEQAAAGQRAASRTPYRDANTAPASAAGDKAVKTYTLTPEKYQKAIAFARARYRLYFVRAAYGMLVLVLVLSWRMAPKYRDWAERASSRRIVQAMIFAPLMVLTLDIFDLPLAAYSHALRVQYEQSVQGWPSWFWDWTKDQLIGFVLATLLVWILYAVIRRSPRRWWFYFWLAALPILIFVIFISPLVIDPLFYKFEPLARRQPELTREIERVVHRAGMEIPRERMFEMIASTKQKSLNAYVTGFGASKRVVVWDTTMAKATIPQTLYVFGHEMGHYVLNHIPKSIAFLAALFLVCLYAGYRGVHWALWRWGPRWGIRGVDDWASLAVLLLLFAIFQFVSAPAENTFSRYFEHEADLYGLEAIHGIVPNSSQVAGEAFQILGEFNLSDTNPSPFIRFWLYSHPPVAERMLFAQTYDPWSHGQPPKYIK